jgi:hypothetical protein
VRAALWKFKIKALACGWYMCGNCHIKYIWCMTTYLLLLEICLSSALKSVWSQKALKMKMKTLS